MRLKTMFTAIAAIGLFAGTAAAQEGTLKKIKDTGTITIGHRESSIPFSYYDDKQQVVGYAMDLCNKIVDAVKANLKLAKLDVMQPDFLPHAFLIRTGRRSLNAATPNNLERQNRSRSRSPLRRQPLRVEEGRQDQKLEDLKGKTVVSTSGTTNIKQITELNTERNLGLTILPAKDHAEAFLMVETGRAAAFVMDDILLYSLVAGSKAPKDYEISADALSVEPYGIMLRKDDPAFKKVVDDAMTGVYKSGEINKIYDKWFLHPIPPKSVNLNVPMGASFKKVVSKPTDSGDPKDYQ
jgi:glutamate/aspartate transport system substrate-binding protein